MRVRRLGFVAVITITFILGWFLHAWSAAQTEEQESYKKEVQEKLKALDKKIDELKAKAAGLKDDAKAEYNKEMTAAAEEAEGREKGMGEGKAGDCSELGKGESRHGRRGSRRGERL